LAAALALAGCATPTAAELPRPGSADAACAERLHDVCGALLVFYAVNRRLPATFEELQAAAPGPLACPLSGETYVYRPEGLAVEGQSGRLILFDASAAHNGARWGIVIVEPKGSGPLVAQVVLLRLPGD